jgi:hypothetical protein
MSTPNYTALNIKVATEAITNYKDRVISKLLKYKFFVEKQQHYKRTGQTKQYKETTTIFDDIKDNYSITIIKIEEFLNKKKCLTDDARNYINKIHDNTHLPYVLKIEGVRYKDLNTGISNSLLYIASDNELYRFVLNNKECKSKTDKQKGKLNIVCQDFMTAGKLQRFKNLVASAFQKKDVNYTFLYHDEFNRILYLFGNSLHNILNMVIEEEEQSPLLSQHEAEREANDARILYEAERRADIDRVAQENATSSARLEQGPSPPTSVPQPPLTAAVAVAPIPAERAVKRAETLTDEEWKEQDNAASYKVEQEEEEEEKGFPDAPPPPSEQENHYIALYEYPVQSKDDVPLKKGDVVIMLNKDIENGWSEVKKKDGQKGIVPTLYIEAKQQDTEEEAASASSGNIIFRVGHKYKVINRWESNVPGSNFSVENNDEVTYIGPNPDQNQHEFVIVEKNDNTTGPFPKTHLAEINYGPHHPMIAQAIANPSGRFSNKYVNVYNRSGAGGGSYSYSNKSTKKKQSKKHIKKNKSRQSTKKKQSRQSTKKKQSRRRPVKKKQSRRRPVKKKQSRQSTKKKQARRRPVKKAKTTKKHTM